MQRRIGRRLRGSHSPKRVRCLCGCVPKEDLMLFRYTRTNDAFQRALRAAVASHRPAALRALLASHGDRGFAKALSKSFRPGHRRCAVHAFRTGSRWRSAPPASRCSHSSARGRGRSCARFALRAIGSARIAAVPSLVASGMEKTPLPYAGHRHYWHVHPLLMLRPVSTVLSRGCDGQAIPISRLSELGTFQ